VLDREAQDLRAWRDKGDERRVGLSGAMNKRDETDKANWIDPKPGRMR